MSGVTMDRWQSGIQFEIDFWRNWLQTRGDKWPERFKEKFDPDTPLEINRDYVRVPESGEYFVLDVGAGPATHGKRIPGVDVKMTAVDPLADLYTFLMVQEGLSSPVPTFRVAAEEILEVFGHHRFDLITCRNALDHTRDPIDALQQMLKVLRPGGDIQLHHATNEGSKANYVGFHSWNFEAADGRFRVWRPDGMSVYVDEVLEGAARIHAEPDVGADWHWVFIRAAE
jgi:SAM-dependent methyltransferase